MLRVLTQSSSRTISAMSLRSNIGSCFKCAGIRTTTHKSTDAEADSLRSLPTSPLSWEKVPPLRLSALPAAYARLTKIKLGGLVVATTMAGYAIAPAPFDLTTFALTSFGTALCVASANSFNQWIEIPYDAQMSRTKTRPLVTGQISPFHAFSVGVGCGLVGTSILALTVNPTVAMLGFSNIVLYAGVYTPMKRWSIANTWAGSIVGAIPPIMGWAAATGSIDPGASILALILFSWQFPHFNALSWKLRGDYSKAGYRMMSVTDPDLCKRVAFRHTLYLLGLSVAAPLLDVTSWTFLGTSSLLNGYFAYKGYRFWNDGNDKTARSLFMTSLWHLPALMVLLMLHKKRSEESEQDSNCQ